MGNTLFQFKQFAVEQGKCAMKISTDAVVLGALADTTDPMSILDIGTGTGVLALMLAQRFPYAKITAIEIEESAFSQAKENFLKSPWQQRLNVVHQDFNEYIHNVDQKFDLIVSNPPYYPNHLVSPNFKKNLAHHHTSLNFEELVEGVQKLLSPQGSFWLILPPDQMKQFNQIALLKDLKPFCQLSIYDKPESKKLREVVGFSMNKEEYFSQKDFFIKDRALKYSKEYRDLLKDFLLKL
jgi:tRNA1Val (adenine37-N6)-methyltransferase